MYYILLALFFAASFISSPSKAKDLGVHGHCFEISERSLLEVILERLNKLKQTGKIETLQKNSVQRVVNTIRNPPDVSNVSNTLQPRVFYYDPTLNLADDIKDHAGRRIASRGQKLNPLSYIAWGSPLIFINGKDENQLAWAKSQDSQSLIVLTAGSPFALTEILKKPIYFDQGGLITKRFGIGQVPCRITQEDLRLKIEEVKPEIEQRDVHAPFKEGKS